MSDGYWDYVTLHLPFDGPDASTNIQDYSNSKNSISTAGNVQLDTAQSKFGGTSGKFDGSGDYLNLGTSLPDSLKIGEGDFTIETWVYLNSTATQAVIGNLNDQNGAGSWWMILNSTFTGLHSVQLGTDTATNKFGTTTLATGEWLHIALSREGTDLRCFVNGTQLGSTTTQADFTGEFNVPTYVGVQHRASSPIAYPLNGWLDDLRVTKGIARYTADFDVPTEAFPQVDPLYPETVLILDMEGTDGGSTFIDTSPKASTVTASGGAVTSDTQFKFGSTSGEFDGTSHVEVADDDDYDLGTDDFTLEFWIYFPSGGSSTGIILEKGGLSLSIFYGGSREVALYVSGNGSSWNVLADQRWVTNPTSNTWYHCALTRQGNVWRQFWDGALVRTNTTSSAIHTNTSPLCIGGKENDTVSFDGFIDDFRLTKGHARYTAAFTPPPTPVSTQSWDTDALYGDVSLLLPFDGDATDVGPEAHTVTEVGSPVYVDGRYGQAVEFGVSSDYLTVADDPSLELGSGDFTIEFDFKFDSLNSNNAFMGKFTDNVVDQREWLIRYDTGNWVFVYSTDGNNDTSLSFAGSPGTGVWYHLAFVREGNELSCYFQGGRQGTVQTLSSTIYSGTAPLYIGAQNNGSIASPSMLFGLKGQIDNIRITKGVARYSGPYAWVNGPFPESSGSATSYDFELAAGAFSLTGGALSIAVESTFELEAGSYSLSGGDLNPNSIGFIALEAGDFSLVGGDVVFNNPLASTLVFPNKEGLDEVDITQLDEGELAINITYGKMYTRDSEFNLYTVGGLYNASELPRSDPGVSGAFWNDDGVLKVSA